MKWRLEGPVHWWAGENLLNGRIKAAGDLAEINSQAFVILSGYLQDKEGICDLPLVGKVIIFFFESLH